MAHTPCLHQAIVFDDPLGDFRSKLAQGVPQILQNELFRRPLRRLSLKTRTRGITNLAK